MDVAKRLEAVEMENDMLRERIAQLEALLHGVRAPPIEFRLTGQESLIFGLLLHRSVVTKDMILSTLYRGFGKDEAEAKIADVYICKMRRKLKPFAIEILTHWGRGWEMPAASRLIAREMISASELNGEAA
jgi:DNA-binding response OmpR family regulator